MMPHDNLLLLQVLEPAKIQKLHQNFITLAGDANIVWLEISMHEAALVHRGQRRCQLKGSMHAVP